MPSARRGDRACRSCHTPAPVGASFCPSCGQPLTAPPADEERRVVSVLFADLAGFTSLAEGRDPESVKELLDECFDVLVPVIEAHGGHIDKIIGDELMALFGAPVAHEDDPERAVRAALGLSASIDQLGPGLTLRIAVNTGEVLAGPVGPGRAYTVTGDVVNTAHRLAGAAAPGEILVGERTRTATADVIHYAERPAFNLRGKEAPVAAWAALGVAERSAETDGPEIALVGRERELRQLTRFGRRCFEERRATVIPIIGEAGVGKSRLARALDDQLQDVSHRTVRITCPPYGAANLLTPLTELASQLLGVDTTRPVERQREDARRAVAELFGEGARELSVVEARLARLLGLNVLPEASLEPDSGPARARVMDDLLAGVRRLLRAQGEHVPTLVVVDDAQWADDVVLEFLSQVPTRCPDVPLLLLVLAREDVLERRSSLLSGREGVTPLPLGPLSADASLELLGTLLQRTPATLPGGHAPAVGPAGEQHLLAAAGGNPLLLEELVRYLVDLNGSGDDEVLPILSEGAGVPDTVRSLLGARLDALPLGDRRVLLDASIVGHRFWLSAVATLGRHDELDVVTDRLVARGLLEAVADSRGDSYTFRHALTREVAYASVPLAERASKHARIARWLRENGDGLMGQDQAVAFLAHHYERSVMSNRELEHTDPGLAGAAFTTLVRAAQNAARRQSLREADHWYSRALELGSFNRTAALDAQLGHGVVLTALRHLDQARTTLETVCREAAAEHPELLAAASAQLAVVARLQGDSDTPRTFFENARRYWNEVGDVRGEAEVLRLQGWSDLSVGRPRTALKALRKAESMERSLGDGQARPDTLQHLGWCEFLVGDIAAARPHLWDAAVRFSEVDDVSGMGWCWGILGFTFLACGDLTRTREIAENLRNVSRERADHLSEATGTLLLAAALAEGGEVTRGAGLAAEATRTFVEVGDVWGSTVSALTRAQCARASGDLDAARRQLDDALTLSVATPWIGEEPRLLIELAGVETDADRVDEAMRRARAALALVRGGMGDHDSEVRALRVLGELAWHDGDLATAELLLDEAVALGEGVSEPTNAWSRAMSSLAVLQLELGDRDAAEAHARLAMAHAGQSVRSVVLAARAAAAVALARGDRAEAAHLLAEALDGHEGRSLVFLSAAREELAELL